MRARAPVPTPVRVTTRPLWRIRAVRDAPRHLLLVLSLAGLAASARFAIAPPTPVAAVTAGARYPAQDRPAEGFAVLFARRYLTWSALGGQNDARALAGFVGAGMTAAAGFIAPQVGEQHVEWAEVVQERSPAVGAHVYTVAAQTDAGVVYLTVPVARTTGGTLVLNGYPAFVGPPANGPAQLGRGSEVSDANLTTVVTRALRNYMGSAAGELAADLASGTHVSMPTVVLTLLTVQRIDWARGGRSVVALVTAQDERGGVYTLEYEIDVVMQQGRWEVAALQADPEAI
jgi:hypothetical protein